MYNDTPLGPLGPRLPNTKYAVWPGTLNVFTLDISEKRSLARNPKKQNSRQNVKFSNSVKTVFPKPDRFDFGRAVARGFAIDLPGLFRRGENFQAEGGKLLRGGEQK